MSVHSTLIRCLTSVTLALTLLSGCSHTAEKPASAPTLIQELDARIPMGWHRSQLGDYAVYQPPERNITMAIASFPTAALEQEIKRANDDIIKIAPSFKPKVKRIDRELTKEGLGKVDVNYKSESNSVPVRLAQIVRQKDAAHFALFSLDGNTYVKRRGQISHFLLPLRKRTAKRPEDIDNAKPVNISARSKNIDAAIKKAMTKLGMPGLLVGIVQNGKVVFQKAYGVKSLTTKEPVTLDTMFAIGSVGKSLTSLLAAKLVDDGKLSWDSKIATHLTDWQGSTKPVLRDITLLQSFCACTGYPRRDSTFAFKVHGIPALERINEMAAWQPNAMVGELFQYSNHMYAVGGFSAARAYRPALSLEQAYDHAMSDLVFKPLGMTNSIARLTTPRAKAALPHGRSASGQFAVIPEKYDQKYNSIAPAGSAWSTLPDMLKYLQLELSKGSSVPGYISEQNLLIRRKPRTPIGFGKYYGLGFIIDSGNPRSHVSHGGNTDGFTSSFDFFPDDNWGYVVLGNYGNFNAFSTLIEKIIENEAYGRKNDGDKLLAKVVERRKYEQRAEQDFLPKISNPRQLLGRYHNAELGSIRILSKDRALWADIGDYAAELRERPSTKGDSRKFDMVPPYASVGVLEYKDGTFVSKGAANQYIFRKSR